MHHDNNPDHQSQQTPALRPICHHSFEPTRAEPARRCGSPALRGEAFCYYHHPTRKAIKDPHQRRARRIARRSLSFPLPTNRAELQHALLYLTHLIATNEIDTRRAGLLLLALQTATKTLTD